MTPDTALKRGLSPVLLPVPDILLVPSILVGRKRRADDLKFQGDPPDCQSIRQIVEVYGNVILNPLMLIGKKELPFANGKSVFSIIWVGEPSQLDVSIT